MQTQKPLTSRQTKMLSFLLTIPEGSNQYLIPSPNERRTCEQLVSLGLARHYQGRSIYMGYVPTKEGTLATKKAEATL